MKIFTIHYGEIKTVKSMLKYSNISSFTIHYGEIKTEDAAAEINSVLNLQSTMVRLRRSAFLQHTRHQSIYNPLW